MTKLNGQVLTEALLNLFLFVIIGISFFKVLSIFQLTLNTQGTWRSTVLQFSNDRKVHPESSRCVQKSFFHKNATCSFERDHGFQMNIQNLFEPQTRNNNKESTHEIQRVIQAIQLD